jgi:hypothetical protein
MKTFVLLFMICNGTHGECHQNIYRFFTKQECLAAQTKYHEDAQGKYLAVSDGCYDQKKK